MPPPSQRTDVKNKLRQDKVCEHLLAGCITGPEVWNVRVLRNTSLLDIRISDDTRHGLEG